MSDVWWDIFNVATLASKFVLRLFFSGGYVLLYPHTATDGVGGAEFGL